MKWMLTIAMMTSVMTTTAQGFENAHDAVHHMSIGWNLGNTLESCNNHYGEKLIFEGWGEIIDKYGAWNFPKDSSAFEACNRFAQSFVNTVRRTGGNNAQRNLMLCTYSATPGGYYMHDGKAGYSDDALAKFDFPKDSADDHLIASVHSYIPWNWDQNHAKLTDKHIEEIKHTFEKFDKYILSRNMPLVIVVEEGTKRGISLLYFMGLIDKEDRTRLQWSRPKTVKAIVDTYKKINNE